MYRYYLGGLLLCTSKEKLTFSIHFPHIKEEYIEEKKKPAKKPVKKEKDDV